MKLRRMTAASLFLIPMAIVSALPAAGWAAEVRVLSLTSLRSSLEGLVPEFEQKTGHKVNVTYGDSSSLPPRFAAGEPFDVALASLPLLERQIKEKRVVPTSRTDVARVAIGVAVRKGSPKPDVSTPDALKRTLLNASSVSHAAEGPSGVYFVALLKRLDIADAMQSKLRPVPGGPKVVGPVARGEVELAVITIPFIVAEAGADLAGALPDELQEYVVYAAGVGANAHELDAANALIRHITSATAAPVIRAQGLDPVAR
jgi:molybdate transport system substrate-binding protein